MVEITQRSVNSVKKLQELICSDGPFLFISSRTSTVIPYAFLQDYCRKALVSKLNLVDLASLPKNMALDENTGVLEIEGPVTWKEAMVFLRKSGFDLYVWPTETEACILAGIATSASGERSFGFGPFREHILEVTCVGERGQIQRLSSDRPLNLTFFSKSDDKLSGVLKKYQESLKVYSGFKNPPFIRLEKETDLMVGSEGQLGAIVSAKFKVKRQAKVQHVAMATRSFWKLDSSLLVEIHLWSQKWRGKIYSLELIDECSFALLSGPHFLKKAGLGDILLFEIEETFLEEVVKDLLQKIEKYKEVDENSLFFLSENDAYELRKTIPREVAEWISRNKAIKMGTDAQVKVEDFNKLLNYYQKMALSCDEKQICYLLFGHFGDAHLHFNLLPKNEEEKLFCRELLEDFYSCVLKMKGSPFAEHGIGLLKQAYIAPFLSSTQEEMYYYLKEALDSKNIFFPMGPLAQTFKKRLKEESVQ